MHQLQIQKCHFESVQIAEKINKPLMTENAANKLVNNFE